MNTFLFKSVCNTNSRYSHVRPRPVSAQSMSLGVKKTMISDDRMVLDSPSIASGSLYPGDVDFSLSGSGFVKFASVSIPENVLQASQVLNVATYNLGTDTKYTIGKYAGIHRRAPVMIDCLFRQKLDIICLQEIGTYTVGLLKKADKYKVIGCKHPGRQINTCDGLAMCYKTDRFSYLDSKIIVHLGSQQNSRKCVDLPAMCSQAILIQDKLTKEKILAVGTHMYETIATGCPAAVDELAKAMSHLISVYTPHRAIILGDLNRQRSNTTDRPYFDFRSKLCSIMGKDINTFALLPSSNFDVKTNQVDWIVPLNLLDDKITYDRSPSCTMVMERLGNATLNIAGFPESPDVPGIMPTPISDHPVYSLTILYNAKLKTH
eukprot:TRINITY_DN156_c0_g1_i1.p1 TRINITY_DN156_c0_g1~~TRINITY_DN156_c0_g1_i1.p1  ORF type:complete len:377 (+),score=-11.02 TRINITY_DN156_c0_g1_i1:111-1241(+)